MRWRPFIVVVGLAILVIAVVLAAMIVPPWIVERGLIAHQRDVTRSLAEWAQEYSQISSDHDAARTADMIDYVQTYYVVGEGYSSTPEVNDRLESQRKQTIQVLTSALQTYRAQQAAGHEVPTAR